VSFFLNLAPLAYGQLSQSWTAASFYGILLPFFDIIPFGLSQFALDIVNLNQKIIPTILALRMLKYGTLRSLGYSIACPFIGSVPFSIFEKCLSIAYRVPWMAKVV
jgi:hypothetical protein